MAISFVKKAVNEKAQAMPTKDLLQVLVKNMGKYYPERSHDVVHASDVTKPGFCPRQYLLMDKYKIKQPDRYINAGLRATFDIGHAVAGMVVEDWMGKAVHGGWVCHTCQDTVPFGQKPGYGCHKQLNCSWKHKEINFVGHAQISGSIDLLADLGGHKLTVVELKIIKVEDFDKLAAPLAEHRLRTRLYLKLIESSDNPIRFKVDTQKAKVLYVSRGFGKMNPDVGQIVPFKEFDVERDDESITEFLKLGEEVLNHRSAGTVSEHKVCPSVGCPQAKKCPVRVQCWSGDA